MDTIQQDLFAYKIDDGHGGSDSSVLAITLQPSSQGAGIGALFKKPEFSIVAVDADKPEGDSGITYFTFAVTRPTLSSALPASVQWSVSANQSPSADGLDFFGGALPNGIVNFGIGETVREVTVAVQGDRAFEGHGLPENFVVTLSNPSSGYRINKLHEFAVAHILDDDSTSISDGFRHPLGSGYLTEESSTSYLGHDEGYWSTKQGSGHGFFVELNFNKLNDQLRNGPSYHLGEDWNGSPDGLSSGNADRGVPVCAISNGQVIIVAENNGLGNYVVIKHDLPAPEFINGEWRTSVFSLYGHLEPNSIKVKVGDIVPIGDQIAELGKSGKGNEAAHLHFEIRLVDPALGPQYQDFDGYNQNGAPSAWYDPTEFINSHRTLSNMTDMLLV